jgi:hypothetical protein
MNLYDSILPKKNKKMNKNRIKPKLHKITFTYYLNLVRYSLKLEYDNIK